jgi:hypothetical protein
MKFACLLLLIVFTLGCGYGNNYSMNTAPGTFPKITRLAPATAMAGQGGFTLTVDGTGFSMNSVVYWNSSSHNATYVMGNQITVAISASEVATPGSVPVYVHANGKNSNTVMFDVR